MKNRVTLTYYKHHRDSRPGNVLELAYPTSTFVDANDPFEVLHRTFWVAWKVVFARTTFKRDDFPHSMWDVTKDRIGIRIGEGAKITEIELPLSHFDTMDREKPQKQACLKKYALLINVVNQSLGALFTHTGKRCPQDYAPKGSR